MNKMFIVLVHEFRQKIRSKAFIILTFVAPLLMGGLIGIPVYISTLNQGNEKPILIIDETGKLGKYFISDSVGSGNKKKKRVEIVNSLGGTVLNDSLKRLLLGKAIEGYLVIPASAIGDTSASAILRVTNTNNFSLQEFLSSRYKDALFAERLKTSEIDPVLVNRASQGTEITTLKVSEEKETSDNGVGLAAGYITGMFLY